MCIDGRSDMTRAVLQYAGNVLVYGPVSPCDGDWYGGVTAEAAEGFLDALTGADIGGHGGVSEAALRPLWRGRMGLSKDEQLQVRHFRSTCGASRLRWCRESKPHHDLGLKGSERVGISWHLSLVLHLMA